VRTTPSNPLKKIKYWLDVDLMLSARYIEIQYDNINPMRFYTMKPALSLVNILTNLLNGAPRNSIELDEFDDETDKRIGTTVRFEPAVKRFIELQATHLGISNQEFVSMTLKAVMNATLQPQSNQLELMTDRFIEIFDAHGIAMADIPRLVPVIQKSDLLSKKTLLDKLSDDVIATVAELFFVDPLWLKGTSDRPHNLSGKRWYKRVDSIAISLAKYSRQCRGVRVLLVSKNGTNYQQLKEAKDKEDAIPAHVMGVVIQLDRSVNGINFTTYDVWEAERWNYAPCRHYLKCIALFCEKAGIFCDGATVATEQLSAFFIGNVLAVSALNYGRGVWHADQFLWGDDRNTELDELDYVRNFYKEKKLDKYILAIQQPQRVKDWEAFYRGDIQIDTD